jgi:hypothetical protein
MRNPILFQALIVWSAFWVLPIFIPIEYLFELVNALAVSLGIGVMFAFWPGMIEALKTPKHELEGGHYLVLGIMTGATAIVAQFAWRGVWRALEQPDWMIRHPLLAFFVYVVATAFALHLSAQGAIGGSIPRRNKIMLGVAVAAALMLTFIAIILLAPAPLYAGH